MSYQIIMPTLNEEEHVERCIDSLGVSNLVIADSASKDRTRSIARGKGCLVIDAPTGKLSARDRAIRQAQAEIIIAVDADSIYPKGFIWNILKHFRDSNVVGVTGPRIFHDDGPMMALCSAIWGMSTKNFSGGCSAFRRSAYLATGGFRKVNEKSHTAVMREEEIEFGKRLAQIGKVVFDPNCYSFYSARRYQAGHAYQKEIGKSRF